MNHGPSRILTCPHCGTKKEVISLLSGNTVGGVVWSDQYVEYPFYKVASDIQKCPHCHKYYEFLNKQLVLLHRKVIFFFHHTEMPLAFRQSQIQQL